MKFQIIILIALGLISSTNAAKKGIIKCGGENYGSCPEGYCCSKNGYCGTTNSYCKNGCQPEYGICYDTKNNNKKVKTKKEKENKKMKSMKNVVTPAIHVTTSITVEPNTVKKQLQLLLKKKLLQ